MKFWHSVTFADFSVDIRFTEWHVDPVKDRMKTWKELKTTVTAIKTRKNIFKHVENGCKTLVAFKVDLELK